MRVITFSRYFPKGHPHAGEPTHFVEQIYNCLYTQVTGDWSDALGTPKSYVVEDLNYTVRGVKGHTIRAGHNWKVGDKFSPRVWGTNINPKSGRSGPYQSKQIIIAPDIEIKKIWSVEVRRSPLNNILNFLINGYRRFGSELDLIAKNDGLSLEDLDAWFAKPFKGQIICWNESVNYKDRT